MKKQNLITKILVYVILGLFFIFTIFPLLWLLSLSLKTQIQAFSNPPILIFKPTSENYINLIFASGFLKNFLNSLIIAISSTVVALVIGAPAAYGMLHLKRKNRSRLFVLTLLTRMAPSMTYIIPFFIVFSKFGLIDTRFALVVAYQTFALPMVIIIMRSFFLEIPRSLEEAARIDGATKRETFIKVILPVSAQGLVSTAILTFILCWNEFIFALVLTRRHAATAPIGITNLMQYEGTLWGQMGAGAIILMIPSILISVLVGKYIAKGLMAGAIKG